MKCHFCLDASDQIQIDFVPTASPTLCSLLLTSLQRRGQTCRWTQGFIFRSGRELRGKCVRLMVWTKISVFCSCQGVSTHTHTHTHTHTPHHPTLKWELTSLRGSRLWPCLPRQRRSPFLNESGLLVILNHSCLIVIVAISQNVWRLSTNRAVPSRRVSANVWGRSRCQSNRWMSWRPKTQRPWIWGGASWSYVGLLCMCICIRAHLSQRYRKFRLLIGLQRYAQIIILHSCGDSWGFAWPTYPHNGSVSYERLFFVRFSISI